MEPVVAVKLSAVAASAAAAVESFKFLVALDVKIFPAVLLVVILRAPD